MSNFPWLCSNVQDSATGKPWCGSKDTHIVEFGGRKLGLVGLVEQEWMATLGTVDPDDIEYEDFVEAGNRLGAELRAQGCDAVIALSHSRVPNDQRLAAECHGVDLVLGGHDHHYEVWSAPNESSGKKVTVVKSGTDFKQLTEITVAWGSDGGGIDVETKRHDITGEIDPDADMEAIVHEHFGTLEEKMKLVIGTVATPLDGRFSKVRTEETSTGNFVCDILRREIGADVVILGGGTLRSDEIQGPGEFTLGDLVKILPMQSSCVLLEVSGQVLLDALHNGVSTYPKLEGRFAQVSGIAFEFDPQLPETSRVIPDTVKVHGEPMDLDRRYTLSTTAYTAGGKDGYDCLVSEGVKVLIDDENGPTLPTVMRNYFRVVQTLNAISLAGSSGASHGALHDAGAIAKSVSDKLLQRVRSKARTGAAATSLPSEHHGASGPLVIAPKVEGRVVRREPGGATASSPADGGDSAAPAAVLKARRRKHAADEHAAGIHKRLGAAKKLLSGVPTSDEAAHRQASARVDAFVAMDEAAAREKRRWDLEAAVAEAVVDTASAMSAGAADDLRAAATAEVTLAGELASFLESQVAAGRESFAAARAAASAWEAHHSRLGRGVARAWLEIESARLLRLISQRSVVVAHSRVTRARFVDGDKEAKEAALRALRGEKLRCEALAAIHHAAVLVLDARRPEDDRAAVSAAQSRASVLAGEAAALGVECPTAADVLDHALAALGEVVASSVASTAASAAESPTVTAPPKAPPTAAAPQAPPGRRVPASDPASATLDPTPEGSRSPGAEGEVAPASPSPQPSEPSQPAASKADAPETATAGCIVCGVM